jgi:hypothetical protein
VSLHKKCKNTLREQNRIWYNTNTKESQGTPFTLNTKTHPRESLHQRKVSTIRIDNTIAFQLPCIIITPVPTIKIQLLLREAPENIQLPPIESKLHKNYSHQTTEKQKQHQGTCRVALAEQKQAQHYPN